MITSAKLPNIFKWLFDATLIIPNIDLKIKDEVIISKRIILDTYDEINKNTSKSVKARIDKLILLLNKYIDQNKDRIIIRLINKKADKKVIDEFKNNINFYLKKNFNVVNKKVKKIYYN